jgi:hypothetical protein
MGQKSDAESFEPEAIPQSLGLSKVRVERIRRRAEKRLRTGRSATPREALEHALRDALATLDRTHAL